jgi:RNA polymerase sigma-70 factor (ECF subfamily)
LEFQQFDEEYLARLRQGDPEVEAHFTAYFGQLILIKLRRRLRSREAIEDVRQETFLRVFQTLRSASGLRRAESLGSFVNSVCNNVFLEACRTNQRHRVRDDDPSALPDTSDDVVLELVCEEERREVRRVLDELAERDRGVLCALFLDEASRDAVCARFQVDRGYLRVLLHRAKEAFRARCAERGGPLLRASGGRPQARTS